MSKCLLSIIIPFYNSYDCIDRALKSLNNMYRDERYSFNAIIIDDGSNIPLTKKQIGSLDFDIKIFRKNNEGPLKARYFGVKKADSEYVYFLDSDDELMPYFFVDFCKLYKTSVFDVCLVEFYKKKRVIKPKSILPSVIDEHFYLKNLIGNGSIGYSASKIFKRELFSLSKEEINACNVSISEDLLLSIKIFKKGLKYVSLDRPSYIYNESPNSISNNFNYKKIQDTIFVYLQRYKFVAENERTIDYCYDEFIKDSQFFFLFIRLLILKQKRSNKYRLLAELYSLPFSSDIVKQKMKCKSFKYYMLSKIVKIEYLLFKKGGNN